MTFRRQNSDLLLPSSEHPAILYRPHEQALPLTTFSGVAIFPGSFQPLHEGHQQLRHVAQQRLRLEIVYELSIANVAKSQLTANELQIRIAQFGQASVLVTNAARFVEKARIVPQCPFVVGFDTAERIVNPRFYGGDRIEMQNAIQELQELCPRILVGGRLIAGGPTKRFCSASDLQTPPYCTDLFEFIPEEEFRVDVSSSELRANQKKRRAPNK